MSKHWKVYILLRRPSSFPDNISRHIAAKYQIQNLWCWVSGLERIGWLLCPHRTWVFPHPQRIGLLLCPQNAEMCLYPQRVRVLLCSHRARVFAYLHKAEVFLYLHKARVHLYPQRSGVGLYAHRVGYVCTLTGLGCSLILTLPVSGECEKMNAPPIKSPVLSE